MVIRNFFFIVFSISLFADIRTVESFKEVESELLSLGNDALVVFDIDEVLITAVDQALKTPHKEVFRNLVSEFLQRATTEEQKKMLEYRLSLTYLYPNRVLVEKMVVPIIHALQRKGAYVVGITRCRNGRYGIIPQVEQWRKEILWKNGIDFSQGHFQNMRAVLDDIEQPCGGFPKFEQGLLFGRGVSKDLLIASLIHKCQLPVKTIYIFDDMRSHLESLKHLEQFEVHPVEYTGAKKYFRPLSKRQAKWQLYKLLEKGQWFDDQDIEEMGYLKGLINYSIPSFFDLFF
jgi:hypothetical protein